MPDGSKVGQQDTGRRKTRIVAWAMIYGGSIAIGVSPLIALRIGMPAFMIFAILDLVVFSAGIALLAKSGRSGMPSTTQPRFSLKWFTVAIGLFILGILIMFVPLMTGPMNLPLFFLSIGLLLAGAVALVPRGGATRYTAMMERFAIPGQVMEAFKQIEPDKSFETKNLFWFRKGDIYILVPRVFNRAYFLKVSRHSPTTKAKLKLPFRIFRKKYFTKEIGGVPVAKTRGEYRIPVDIVKSGGVIVQEKYAIVSAILYLVPRYDVLHRTLLRAADLSYRFDRDMILKIMEELSAEEERNFIQ